MTCKCRNCDCSCPENGIPFDLKLALEGHPVITANGGRVLNIYRLKYPDNDQFDLSVTYLESIARNTGSDSEMVFHNFYFVDGEVAVITMDDENREADETLPHLFMLDKEKC